MAGPDCWFGDANDQLTFHQGHRILHGSRMTAPGCDLEALADALAHGRDVHRELFSEHGDERDMVRRVCWILMVGCGSCCSCLIVMM
jgi:hypothetical protein